MVPVRFLAVIALLGSACAQHSAASASAVNAHAMRAAALQPSPDASGTTAFVGGRVITMSGPELADGTLIVTDGKIVSVGPRDEVDVPQDATVVDLSGKVLMPGLVCTHSHVGSPWGADGSAPIQPGVRNLDSLNVRSADIQRAQAGGVTTANVMPGSGHLMSGQTTYLKLRDGRTVDELLILTDDGQAMGGMKMANGTNSQRDPPFPGTRGKSAALVRSAFIAAQDYGAKVEAAGDDASKRPPRDLGKEALLQVLSGERVVHHHTHRHDDIVTVLRLREEFGFRLVLQHVSEAFKVPEEIAAAGVPCSLILIDAPGGKIEAADMGWRTGAVLEQHGIPVAFHTDDPVNDSRLMVRSAALAHRAGMSREGALASVTRTAAEMLDLGDRVGTLQPGKDADLSVWSADPLSVYAMVEQTWIEGVRVFDLSDERDALYAYGGEGASHDMTDVPLCCLEGNER